MSGSHPAVARGCIVRAKADGGEAGIRTLDTGFGPYNGLANRRLQPLGHLTVRPVSIRRASTCGSREILSWRRIPQDGEQKNRRLHVNPRLNNAFHGSRDADSDHRMGTVSGTVDLAHVKSCSERWRDTCPAHPIADAAAIPATRLWNLRRRSCERISTPRRI
jgi:hypothetical protein